MEYMFALRAQNRHGFRTVVNTLDGKNISLQVEVCDRQTIYHPSKFFWLELIVTGRAVTPIFLDFVGITRAHLSAEMRLLELMDYSQNPAGAYLLQMVDDCSMLIYKISFMK